MPKTMSAEDILDMIHDKAWDTVVEVNGPDLDTMTVAQFTSAYERVYSCILNGMVERMEPDVAERFTAAVKKIAEQAAAEQDANPDLTD